MIPRFRPFRAYRAAVAVLAALLLLPASVSAQFDAATVLGSVRDSSGGVVPGATVTLKNVATGITATTVSDSNGDYQFLNVRIGTYTVRGELQGFSVAEAENVQVTVNARQRVDLALKVGNIGETVVVTGAATLLESGLERPRPGHRQGADRQPAAERPGLRRPRPAQPRRAPLGDLRVAGCLVQRQRPAQRAQQLHPRRRRQQLLRHEQPGLLQPGRAGVARRGGRIQGPDQQLQRRVRPHRRRRRQRLDAQRDQPVPRHAVGVQPQRRAERGRLLQAEQRRQAEAQSQPVRLRLRRSRGAQPHLLLRRLRGLPPGLEGDDVRQHPDAGAAPGGARPADPEPADRRGVCQRRHPGGRHHPLRQAGAGRPAGADPRRGRRTTSTRCRAARTSTTSSTSSWIISSTPG